GLAGAGGGAVSSDMWLPPRGGSDGRTGNPLPCMRAQEGRRGVRLGSSRACRAALYRRQARARPASAARMLPPLGSFFVFPFHQTGTYAEGALPTPTDNPPNGQRPAPYGSLRSAAPR